jgi:hypothetical protein
MAAPISRCPIGSKGGLTGRPFYCFLLRAMTFLNLTECDSICRRLVGLENAGRPALFLPACITAQTAQRSRCIRRCQNLGQYQAMRLAPAPLPFFEEALTIEIRQTSGRNATRAKPWPNETWRGITQSILVWTLCHYSPKGFDLRPACLYFAIF